MGKYQEEKKTPIIMVKKRRTLLPPSLSEKTGVIARSETVKMEDPVSVGSSWGRLRKRKIKHAKPVAEAVAA